MLRPKNLLAIFALRNYSSLIYRKEAIMNKLVLFVGVILIAFSVKAQNLQEVDGIYFLNSTPYSGTYETYYADGTMKMETTFLEGKKEGECKLYFENGELNEIRSYNDNEMDGTWLTFNKLGVKVAEASYKNGKKDGNWYVWDDEGNLKYELCYKDGEKTGVWKGYDAMGVVINERDYTSL